MAEESRESHHEQLDRELIELLNEIRVLLPGVQVLFAFLLTAPFAIGFDKVTDFQRNVYALSLFSALAAIACLVSPTTYHRIQWRQRDKDAILRVSNRSDACGLRVSRVLHDLLDPARLRLPVRSLASCSRLGTDGHSALRALVRGPGRAAHEKARHLGFSPFTGLSSGSPTVPRVSHQKRRRP